MRKLTIALIPLLILVLVVSGCEPVEWVEWIDKQVTLDARYRAEQKYLDSYVEAHNEMAGAERYYNTGIDYARGQMYDQAVQQFSQAKRHADKAIVAATSMLTAVSDITGKKNYRIEEVKEARLWELVFKRASSFSDAMENFILSLWYLRNSDIDIPSNSDPISILLSLSMEVLQGDYQLRKAQEEQQLGNEALQQSWGYFAETVQLSEEIPPIVENVERQNRLQKIEEPSRVY